MVDTCATCCFWDGAPSAARGDCLVGQLTYPWCWQSCGRWAPRVMTGNVAQQSQVRGDPAALWGAYFAGIGEPKP